MIIPVLKNNITYIYSTCFISEFPSTPDGKEYASLLYTSESDVVSAFIAPFIMPLSKITNHYNLEIYSIKGFVAWRHGFEGLS